MLHTVAQVFIEHGADRESVGVVAAVPPGVVARSGVARLLLIDNLVITLADLSYMQFQAQDVGTSKDEQLARTLHRLNPDVDVRAAGVALDKTQSVVDALRSVATRTTGGRSSAAAGDERNGIGASNDDDRSDSDSDDANDDASDGSEHEPGGRGAISTSRNATATSSSHSLHVVFLCVQSAKLASALNEFCCEFDLLFVFACVGTNGMSGEVLAVAPGRSSCLQCLERRKVIKTSTVKDPPPPSPSPSPSAVTAVDQTEFTDQHQVASHSLKHQRQHHQLQYRLRPCLPSTECILSGLGVHNAVVQLLGFGAFCSRVEFDGLLDEMDRNGLVPPVRQCPSAFCRLQQQRHQQCSAGRGTKTGTGAT